MRIFILQYDEDDAIYPEVFLTEQSAQEEADRMEEAGFPCSILETTVYEKDLIVH